MPYLFDTIAISEAMRPRPNEAYVEWLRHLPREDQFTCTVVIGEMYAGAYASQAPAKWLERIEKMVLPAMTVLSFDLPTAHEYGRMRAVLRRAGRLIEEADMMIAATAVHHGLILVTANVSHFSAVPELSVRGFSPGAAPG
ncbi:MAG: PIN domain-containing protein [Candidatus Schekmanbacteria bacterium]|nr:PIN domain-containing protein [Candidatus Schekmanbacteria bacterium]